jgi:apolipoprotein N-acyltransferase
VRPWLFAAAGGLLVAFPFFSTRVWPLAVLGVALITLAARGRSVRGGLLVGLLAGLATFIPLLYWLHVVGYDAWLGLAVAEAVLLAPLGIGLALVTRLRAWPVWAASVWVAEEAWRDRLPFGGFPWGRLAFGQSDSPFTAYAALAGAPGVTVAVASAGALLAAAIVAAEHRRRRGLQLFLVGTLAVVLLGLVIPTPTAGQASAAGPSSAVIAAVQGNVPHPGLHFLGRPEQVLDNHAGETLRLADAVAAGRVPRPDVVIWPENSSDLDPYTDASAAAVITNAVDRIGVPTLVGAVVDDREHPETFVDNNGIVWTPGVGPGESYTKQHPVPFGEYVPWRSVLTRYIGRLSLVPKDFAHGQTTGVLQLGPVRIGDVICFEIAYDGLVRDTVNAGGRVIVVQTNNATYSRTQESAQQLAIARLRAVEHGRTVIVAATSGISAVIAPDGRIIERTAELVPATLVHRVPLRDSRTIADRLGGWPELVFTLIALGAVAAAIVVTRRRSAEDGL